MKRVINTIAVLVLCLTMVFSSVSLAFAADEVGKSGNIVIGNVTATTVEVRWRAVDGVKGYVLYRATDPNGEWSSVGKATDRTLTDKDAKPGTVYYYKVRAYKLKQGLFGDKLDIENNRIYGDYSKYTSKPLKDFIYESNKGKDIFFVSTKGEAVEYLITAGE